MRQRLAGLLVLAVAAVLLMVVAAVGGRNNPGRAVAAPPPLPPRPGDCQVQDPGVPGHSLDEWALNIGAARLEPCQGLRFGDVAGFVDVAAAGTGVDDDPVSAAYVQCLDIASAYVGVPRVAVDERGLFIPAASVGVAMAGPDLRQLAAGQHWGACVVFPYTGEDRPPAQYYGALRDVWSRGLDARVIAACTNEADATTLVDCRGPHHFELFGWSAGAIADDIQQADLEDSCRQLILASTGLPDVTAHGALAMSVDVIRYHEDGSVGLGLDPTDPAEAYATCLIEPTDEHQMLMSSLRGIRGAKLPFN